MGVEAIIVTVVTEGLSKPLPLQQRVYYIAAGFALATLEIAMLYGARGTEEAHRAKTIRHLDALTDRTGLLLESQSLLRAARNAPEASLKSRVLAMSGAILALLARPGPRTTIFSLQLVVAGQAAHPEAKHRAEIQQAYFSELAPGVNDLHGELSDAGVHDQKLDELLTSKTVLSLTEIREVAERLEALGRSL